MPRLAALSAQTFNSKVPIFDSGFVTNGDFRDPIGTFLNPWSVNGNTAKTANNQVLLTGDSSRLTQTVGGLPTSSTLTLQFYIVDFIDLTGNFNGTFVHWNTNGVPEQTISIRTTGLITATVNTDTSTSGSIEFNCLNNVGNRILVDNVGLYN